MTVCKLSIEDLSSEAALQDLALLPKGEPRKGFGRTVLTLAGRRTISLKMLMNLNNLIKATPRFRLQAFVQPEFFRL